MLKVLIAGDDQKVARFLSRALMEEGIVVDRADDGLVALEQIKSGVYDLVILDQSLRRLDGVVLCRQLRRSNCEVLIFIISGYGEARDRAAALSAGADDAIGKPVDIAEFCARVRALSRRSPTFNRERAMREWGHR